MLSKLRLHKPAEVDTTFKVCFASCGVPLVWLTSRDTKPMPSPSLRSAVVLQPKALRRVLKVKDDLRQLFRKSAPESASKYCPISLSDSSLHVIPALPSLPSLPSFTDYGKEWRVLSEGELPVFNEVSTVSVEAVHVLDDQTDIPDTPAAVLREDEIDIINTTSPVTQKPCDGFQDFVSTIPASNSAPLTALDRHETSPKVSMFYREWTDEIEQEEQAKIDMLLAEARECLSRPVPRFSVYYSHDSLLDTTLQSTDQQSVDSSACSQGIHNHPLTENMNSMSRKSVAVLPSPDMSSRMLWTDNIEREYQAKFDTLISEALACLSKPIPMVATRVNAAPTTATPPSSPPSPVYSHKSERQVLDGQQVDVDSDSPARTETSSSSTQYTTATGNTSLNTTVNTLGLVCSPNKFLLTSKNDDEHVQNIDAMPSPLFTCGPLIPSESSLQRFDKADMNAWLQASSCGNLESQYREDRFTRVSPAHNQWSLVCNRTQNASPIVPRITRYFVDASTSTGGFPLHASHSKAPLARPDATTFAPPTLCDAVPIEPASIGLETADDYPEAHAHKGVPRAILRCLRALRAIVFPPSCLRTQGLPVKQSRCQRRPMPVPRLHPAVWSCAKIARTREKRGTKTKRNTVSLKSLRQRLESIDMEII